jgi:predicted O-methyltransferase YrrM
MEASAGPSSKPAADALGFAESYPAEDAVLTAARARADEIGYRAPSAGCGGALRFLASAVRAKAAVEIGTGTGVSGLWVLRGMRPEGVLTSIDVEPEYQRMARATFREAGVPPGRVRLINGRPREVLPRLADASYDLVVVVDGAPVDFPDYLAEALRLLRPGGVVAFDGVLRGGKVADPTARDAETVALRELVRTVREHDGLVPALLPLGAGLLAAVRRD